jgi:HPt (histidine-containing phosphotransfer) domain-containing protein
MSDFAGMEDLLQDFLQEAGDLLSDVDNKLVDLERSPDDSRLLNDIFRGFHTIKGGAGFLNAGELVKLCHLTENLFDKLRNGEQTLTPELMDTIMAATQGVRNMFGEIGQGRQPDPAPAAVSAHLRAALAGPVAAQEVDTPVSALMAGGADGANSGRGCCCRPRLAATAPGSGRPASGAVGRDAAVGVGHCFAVACRVGGQRAATADKDGSGRGPDAATFPAGRPAQHR